MADLYAAMIKAESAWEADDTNLKLLNAADHAREAYFTALAAKRAQWNALPKGEAKDSAEDNAYDTIAESDPRLGADEIAWFDYAIRSYEINLGDGMI